MGILGGEQKADKTIKAVAFDLDGTLYPNYRLYYRLFPQVFLHPFFSKAFMKVRRQLHCSVKPGEMAAPDRSFYEKQLSLLASMIKKDRESTRQKLDRLIYGNLEKHFSRIKLFPGVKETLAAFRSAELRLAVLSDFPPMQKIELLGLSSFFDCTLSTEETGYLKPSGIPFAALADALKLKPENILYVGNSPRFDAEGAVSSGMKAALIRRGVFSTGYARNTGGADFVFRNYRQLQEYVLRQAGGK